MKVIASILLNVLGWNICKLLLQDFGPPNYNILLNLIVVYPNKNIVNDRVDYKSISILVTQKKGMSVFCKRAASF